MSLSPRPTHLPAATVLAFTTALAGCATGSLGDRLGVDVVAQGRVITATVDPRHAWAAALSRQGADLVAEYPTAGAGLVREVVARSAGRSGATLQFTLPERLTGAPRGPVCLYLQARALRKIVPVRRQPVQGDTGRFRFATWETQVREQAALAQLAAEGNALDQRAAAADRAIDARVAELASRGWSDVAACSAVQGPAVSATRPPIGVLPVGEHEAAARRTCVSRALYTQRLSQQLTRRLAGVKDEAEFKQRLAGVSSLAGLGASAATLTLALKGGSDPDVAAVLADRQRAARAFQADMQRYGPQVGEGFYPAFGQPDDYMTLVSQARPLNQRAVLLEVATQAGVPAEQRPAFGAREVLALSSAVIEAYEGCVTDGQRELKVKLQAWQDLQRDAPGRQRRIREHLAQECRSRQGELAALRGSAAALAQEQRRVAADLAAARERSVPQAPDARPQALNDHACVAGG